MKVLIIGLDGETWDVIDDYVLDTCMPNLRRLKHNGCSGILHSTEPAVTPSAWTTCITGCSPQVHGIPGFREYTFKDNTLRIGNATCCSVPNMFEVLSKQGFKVASVNVPWTYPPIKVNGVMISGYGAPGIFAYPEDFKLNLLKAVPDYDIVADWKQPTKADELFQIDQNFKKIERSFKQKLEAAKLVTRILDWDLLMVEFQDLDKVGHYMWHFVGADSRDRFPAQRDRAFEMFSRLDRNIGGLLKLKAANELLAIVVSDHGMGKKEKTVRPNWLLHKLGYVHFQNPLHRALRRTRRNISKWLGKPKGPMPLEIKMPVDLKRTRALLIRAEASGHIYLNVRGRQPFGCVDPGAEYNAILDDLIEKFNSTTCPFTGKPLFSRVVPSMELYGSDVDFERFGDLVLVPASGCAIKSTLTKKDLYVKKVDPELFSGIHRPEGMYVISGPNVKKAEQNTNIADIAPTVYTILGAAIPSYVDGKVLKSAFEQKIPIRYLDSNSEGSPYREQKKKLSAEEEQIVSKRLAELGYLD